MVTIKIAVDDNEVKTYDMDFRDVTLGEIISELNIDKSQVGAVLVDGVPKKLSEKNKDNSLIYILPILGGG
ncbi:hypothetical protein [Sedimentibacter sp. MB31-C6]|uniref:hypothetical protein n=1 Tax=Sedimentibacter sp. MB31-C6 TaxID=3109366 RepID=UPI002DDD2167|nr:hypothetical protein [Sedimentibacter sp. MB36-C1]WSI04746.1 hypothetical protein U8307_02885 [Sedimentibacter sp. MB36-C1]